MLVIVDNEPIIRRVLDSRFTQLGYHVVFLKNTTETLTFLTEVRPQLLIIDINVIGSEIIYEIQTIHKIPIIILTSPNTINHQSNYFDLGADDFIVKPFFPKVLEARVRSVLRRYDQPLTIPIFYFGPLAIDKTTRKVLKNKTPVTLTKIEYDILNFLIKNAGKSLSRETLIQFLWGYSPTRKEDLRIIDVHISRLRSKLEENPRRPKLILTLRGTGYMFQNFNLNTASTTYSNI